MINALKKHWFLIGLTLVIFITLADTSQSVATLGKWLSFHHGPAVVVFLIFLFSGILLENDQIRSGLKDIKATAAAILLIFFVAPLIAALFSFVALPTGVLIGLFLVATMPTTLSSGVVMTASAGGNPAHALFITILSNILSIVTIPVGLWLLLPLVNDNTAVHIDKTAIMLKLGLLLLVPLFSGMLIKRYAPMDFTKSPISLSILNQCLILIMIWMGLSQSRQVLINNGTSAITIFVLVFLFHALLLAATFLLTKALSLGRGRRESVIFMGAQKTLALSIILQVSLFPHYGMALVVCVVHHIVHLLMDGYLVAKIKP